MFHGTVMKKYKGLTFGCINGLFQGQTWANRCFSSLPSFSSSQVLPLTISNCHEHYSLRTFLELLTFFGELASSKEHGKLLRTEQFLGGIKKITSQLVRVGPAGRGLVSLRPRARFKTIARSGFSYQKTT
jgi:hypothetical protein